MAAVAAERELAMEAAVEAEAAEAEAEKNEANALEEAANALAEVCDRNPKNPPLLRGLHHTGIATWRHYSTPCSATFLLKL